MIRRARTILWVAALIAVAGCKEVQLAGGTDAAGAQASEAQGFDGPVSIDPAPADSGSAGCPARQHACGAACFRDDDPTSCGTCDNDCTLLPNVVPGAALCRAGACVVPAGGCLAGHAHCTGDPADICETDLTTADNCGTCGEKCEAGAPFCSNVGGAQVCVLKCGGAAPSKCGTSCVDLKTDVNSCGACGKVCNPPNTIAACEGGRCVPSGCKDGYADCTDDPGCETRLGTNAHCSQCNDACGGNRRCDVAARTCVDLCAGGGTGNAGHCCSARDCPADRPFCDNHICLGRPNGQSCLGAGECATGHCVDGVCCDKTCDGQCEACDGSGTAGTCKPVSGIPHRSAQPQRPLCGGDPSCAGACDGTVTDKCAFQRNQCRAASCSNGVLTSRALCDPDGSCPAISTQSCPFACFAATGTCGGTCKPGTTQCSGLTPQTCDTEGVWRSGAPCADATPKCDPTSHLCVGIAQGEPCAGNNQCKTGHCVENICCDSSCDGACDTGTCGGGTCQHKPARTFCGKREGPHPGWNDVAQYCDSAGKCVFPKVLCGAAQTDECDLTTNACCQSEPSTQESVTISCVPPAKCCDGVSTCNGAGDQRWYGCKSSQHCPQGQICCAKVNWYFNFGYHFVECRPTCSDGDPDFNREVCDLNLPASQCLTGGVCHASYMAPDYAICY